MGTQDRAEKPYSHTLLSPEERAAFVATERAPGAVPQTRVRLTGDAAKLAALFDKLDGRRSSSPRLAETFYDTADSRLWRHGYSLRLRRKGRGQELALRSQGRSAIHLQEWTAAVDGQAVDLALLPPEAPRGDIGVVLPEELQSKFSSEVKKTRKRIRLDGAEIEVSLCVGLLKSGKRESPVNELEFVLLDGDVAVMLAQIKTLLRRRRMTLEARSRAARGMELAEDTPPAWVKAAKPTLQATDTLGDAMAKIIAVTAKQITGNIAAAADGRDPEGVHQLRVALRRLRSAFSLFKGHLADEAGILNQEARDALKHLGPARDLDVFLTETLPPVLGGDDANPGLVRLAGRAEIRSRAAYREVRTLVGSPRFNGFLFDLLLSAENGGSVIRDRDTLLRPVAVKLLQKRHKKVLKTGREFAHLSTARRHEVRIALKKLRYACDYFQTLFPKKSTAAYLKRLESLQNDLGWLNDATVAEHLVDDLAADDMQAALGGALVKGWYRHRLVQVEPHMVAAWQDFTETRPFWRA